MSWNNASSGAPKLELKLNLSPPRVSLLQHPPESSSPRRRSVSSPTTSPPPSSCMSSESQDDDGSCRSPEEATSMVLVGCPRCLMYVMLAEAKPNKCPMCHTSVLLDVIYDHTKKART